MKMSLQNQKHNWKLWHDLTSVDISRFLFVWHIFFHSEQLDKMKFYFHSCSLRLYCPKMCHQSIVKTLKLFSLFVFCSFSYTCALTFFVTHCTSRKHLSSFLTSFFPLAALSSSYCHFIFIGHACAFIPLRFFHVQDLQSLGLPWPIFPYRKYLRRCPFQGLSVNILPFPLSSCFSLLTP